MTTIYLVQHGVAVDEAEDPARPLSAVGIAEVERVAARLAAQGVTVTEVCHSGKLRARQTAERFAEKLGARAVREIPGLAPKDDPRELQPRLADGVMYVGHLPHLRHLAALLLTGDPANDPVALRNGGVVCLDEAEGRARLRWYLPPELC